MTREKRHDGAEVDALIERSSKYVFLQAVEAICGRDARAHFQEKRMNADMPGVLMRRIIMQKTGEKPPVFVAAP